MSGPTQYCTFFIDGALFGLEIEHIQEIIRYQEMTRIPLAPREVAGLMNLRGQIVPAIDLRRCFAMPEQASELMPTNIVIQTADGAVSLLTDDIGDILALSEETFELPPDNLRGPVRAIIRGVHKLSRGLMMVLSIEAVIAVATAEVAGDHVFSVGELEHPRHGRQAS
jgi:purine-binding chemotaxis protein CheW